MNHLDTDKSVPLLLAQKEEKRQAVFDQTLEKENFFGGMSEKGIRYSIGKTVRRMFAIELDDTWELRRLLVVHYTHRALP